MNDKRLRRHLAVAVVVKLALLAAIWTVFVHPQSAAVDAAGAADHLITPSVPPGRATDRAGDPS